MEDGASEADVFAERARKLLKEDKVVTIFGCWSSASRKRVAAVCAEYDRLLMYPNSCEGLEENSHVFYLGGGPAQVLLPIANWAYGELNKRRFLLVGSEEVYSKGAHAILTDDLKRLGATVVDDLYFPLGEAGFAKVVDRVEAGKVDIILNTVSGTCNVALLGTLRKAGITPERVPTVWFNIQEHELRHLGEKRMLGDYSIASIPERGCARQPSLRQALRGALRQDAAHYRRHADRLPGRFAVEAGGGGSEEHRHGPSCARRSRASKSRRRKGSCASTRPRNTPGAWPGLAGWLPISSSRLFTRHRSRYGPGLSPIPDACGMEEVPRGLYRGWGNHWEEHAP